MRYHTRGRLRVVQYAAKQHGLTAAGRKHKQHAAPARLPFGIHARLSVLLKIT
jgi:hypothetical protein